MTTSADDTGELGDVIDGVDGATTPSQDRSRRSTIRLLQAASELIAERGYARTTLAAVGRRAGFSHALVNRRFGSKENLVLVLFERMVSDWRRRVLMPVMADTPATEAVCFYIEAIRSAISNDPVAMRALFTLMVESLTTPTLQEPIRELYDAQFRVIRDALEAGIAAATVAPGTDADLQGRLIINALRGATLHWLLVPDFDVDSDLRSLISHVRTLSVEAAISSPPSDAQGKHRASSVARRRGRTLA